MGTDNDSFQTLSPWWRYGVFFTILIGMAILIYISFSAYKEAPPIPERVVDERGQEIFTADDILALPFTPRKH